MKILLYFKQDRKKYYESARLWRNLCQACAFLHLDYTENIFEDYDILHLVTTEHEMLVDQAISLNKKVIISALSTENDLNAMLIKRDDLYILRPKARRVMNKASLILVPSEMSRIILKHNGVETPIQILEEGVDSSRFEQNKLEMSLFKRYYGIQNDNQLIVACGKYQEDDGLLDFYKLAQEMPNVNFVWFGHFKMIRAGKFIKRAVKNPPKNLRFERIVDENVFASALLNATIYLIPGKRFVGTVTILDAIAAECYIVARDKAVIMDDITHNKTALICKSYRELYHHVTMILTHEPKEVMINAQAQMQGRSLLNVGKKLDFIYNQLYALVV